MSRVQNLICAGAGNGSMVSKSDLIFFFLTSVFDFLVRGGVLELGDLINSVSKFSRPLSSR